MKRKSINVLLATTLALLIPSPGRFVYGFVLVLEMNLLLLTGTLVVSFVKKIKMEELMSVIVIFMMLAVTILFRQIFVIIQPEIILTLGYIIYLVPLSLFMFGYIFESEQNKLLDNLKNNMIHLSSYSVFSLVFFLLRDLAGYGTFTFFGKNHQIYEKVIITSERIGVFSFIASIPGALILSAIILYVYVYTRNKIDVYKKAEECK